jgi:hypothetical protein
MTVLITLTSSGDDTGPFSLYSNVDGFVTPFETGITKAALDAGYSSSLVPNFTATIRVKSTGACTNYTDVPVLGTTSTTTTTSSSTTTSTTTATPVSIYISTANCRATGNCNDNSLCSVEMPVIITGITPGYVTATIDASTDATASYFAGVVTYTENNALGSVTITLRLYDTLGGTLLDTTTQTLTHQSFYQYLPVCL